MKSLLDPIPTPAKTRPSRARWDRYVLGQTSQEERRELEAQLEHCEHSRQLVAEIRAEQQAFRQTMPSAAAFMAQLEEQAETRSLWKRLLAWWKHPAVLTPLAACAAFLLFYNGQQNNKHHRPVVRPVASHPGVIVKGQPEFNVYRFRQSVRSLVKSGQDFKKGDVLGFTYRAAGQRYLFMVLKDQKGELSWLYPNDGQRSIPLASQGKLTDSVELDGASGTEKLYAFFSQKPLTGDEVKALLKHDPQTGVLPQRTSIYVHRFLLKKR
jgi:hypothetical protein